jgi:hypothetical protein
MGLVPSAGATGQKRKGRGAGTSARHGGDEVVAGWRSGWRGARGKGQRGGKQGRGRGRATRGACPSRRWRRGGTGVAVSGADGRRQRGRGRAGEQTPEEEEEGKGSEGPYWNLQKPQGSHCKLNFPTDPKL